MERVLLAAGGAGAPGVRWWLGLGQPCRVVVWGLVGWHAAPGQHGSAARHTDIRGLGPQVG